MSIDSAAASRSSTHPTDGRTPSPYKEIFMRKMIMMAIAGFIWKKIQAKMNKQTYNGTTSAPRRY